MDKKELKKLMTKVAKGEITESEAQILIEGKKTQPQALKQEIQGENKGESPKSKKSHTRKRITKSREGK